MIVLHSRTIILHNFSTDEEDLPVVINGIE